jgi:hypothetical protein
MGNFHMTEEDLARVNLRIKELEVKVEHGTKALKRALHALDAVALAADNFEFPDSTQHAAWYQVRAECRDTITELEQWTPTPSKTPSP